MHGLLSTRGYSPAAPSGAKIESELIQWPINSNMTFVFALKGRSNAATGAATQERNPWKTNAQ